MMFHWESETNGFGAVLDPVVFGRRRFGLDDRLINLRATHFALNQLCFVKKFPGGVNDDAL